MADVRHDIQSLVIRLYFERRRLLASPRRSAVPADAGGTGDRADPAGDPAAENKDERRRLKVQELEAQLEALSGVPFPPTPDLIAPSPGGTP